MLGGVDGKPKGTFKPVVAQKNLADYTSDEARAYEDRREHAAVLKRPLSTRSAALLAEVAKRSVFTICAAFLAEFVKGLVFTTSAALPAEVVKGFVLANSVGGGGG